MARLIELDDPADPRLADYRDLRDVELRKHLEAEHGLFLAEGEKVVRRAVEGGFAPRSFLMAPRWLEGLADVLDRSDETGLKSLRNLADVHVLFVDQLNTYDVLCADDVVFTQAALEAYVTRATGSTGTTEEVTQ